MIIEFSIKYILIIDDVIAGRSVLPAMCFLLGEEEEEDKQIVLMLVMQWEQSFNKTYCHDLRRSHG